MSDRESSPWYAAPTPAEVAGGGIDRARAFLTARNPDAAMREAARVLERFPDGIWAYRALDILADANALKRDWREVAAIGERMLEIRAEALQGYQNLALGLLKLSRWRDFDALTQDGIRAHPNDPFLTQIIGARWRTVGAYDTAELWARRALELRPTNIHFKHDLAVVLVLQDRFDEARALIDEMIAEDPASASVYSVAAFQAFQKNRFAEAAVLADMTLERDPTDTDGQLILKRSRIFGHPLMAPYWRLASLADTSTTAGLVVWQLGLLGLALLIARFGAAWLLIPLGVYWACCLTAVGITEAVYSARDRAPGETDIAIKNF